MSERVRKWCDRGSYDEMRCVYGVGSWGDMLDAIQVGSCKPYCCVRGGVQLCERGCLVWAWNVRDRDELLEAGV